MVNNNPLILTPRPIMKSLSVALTAIFACVFLSNIDYRGQNTFYQLLTGKRTNKTEPSHAVPLDSDTLRTAAAAVAAIAQGETTKPKNTMDPRNRLQLPAAQPLQETSSKPKKAKKEEAPLVEVKIAAGNGVSAVYTSFV